MSRLNRNGGRSAHGRRLHLEQLEARSLLSADLTLVKDINAITDRSWISDPVELSGDLIFSLRDQEGNNELWRSDGSEAGTVLLKQFSKVESVSWLTVVENAVYFAASDGVSGSELWKSDGTPEGTVLVRDIVAGPFSSNPISLVNWDGVLYFSASDAAGRQLWKSDGTEAGTVRVSDSFVEPPFNPSYGYTSGPMTPFVAEGRLFFTARTSTTGWELWTSDGTAVGTRLVKDIRPGTESSAPYHFASMNGILYFNANDGVNRSELWRSDGTEAGTYRLKGKAPGGFLDQVGFNPQYLTVVGDTLYFAANDGLSGIDLWKSDGTSAGTQLAADLNAGLGPLTEMNGVLYFKAGTSSGHELWRSDGTAAGTFQLKEIGPNNFPWTQGGGPRALTNIGGTLYFSANNYAAGYELWKSDGTEKGTVLVRDIQPGSGSSDPRYFTNVNGVAYFSADDGVTGVELWRTDAGEAGAIRVKDFNQNTLSSEPWLQVNHHGEIYFLANDGLSGNSLWKSDGTAAGTIALPNVLPKEAGLGLRQIESVNDKLYFSMENSGYWSRKWELWTSDSSGAAVRIKQIPNGQLSEQKVVAGTIYFALSDRITGKELWKSDGTAAGTVQVKDINPGYFGSNIRSLTNVNGVLYFFAYNGSSEFGLWKSDGSANGTVLVKRLDYVPIDYGDTIAAVGDTLFFTVEDTTSGNELWKSDGTAAGTVRVKDIFPGRSSSYPKRFTNIAGTLYFFANDGATGDELWRSDGTSAGTVQVADRVPGALGQFPNARVSHQGFLYFTAGGGTTPFQLWKSDGTANGAWLVKDFSDYPAFFSAGYMLSAGDKVYFMAPSSRGEVEFWSSDGTTAGTIPSRLVGDISLSVTSSLRVGEQIFITGSTAAVGTELFSIHTPVFSPGDFDRDGDVGLADREFWAANFNATSGIALQADGNNNGVVDAADFTIWRENYVATAFVAVASSRHAVSVSTVGLTSPAQSTTASKKMVFHQPLALSPRRRELFALAARVPAPADSATIVTPTPVNTVGEVITAEARDAALSDLTIRWRQL